MVLSISFNIFSNTTESFAFDYIVNDFTVYPVTTIPRPPKGESIIEPTFHTEIVRITDPTDIPETLGRYAQPGYVKHDIENADGTMLLVQNTYGGAGWGIWNANPPYNFIQHIIYRPGDTGAPIDARWSKTDPDALYYTYGGKFWKWSVKAKAATIVHDFRQEWPNWVYTEPYDRDGICIYPGVTPSLEEEGVQSDDGRYWVFVMKGYEPPGDPRTKNAGYNQYAYVLLDSDTGQIVSRMDRGTLGTDGKWSNPNWSFCNFPTISPSGKWLLIGAPPLHVYDRNWIRQRTLQTHGHVDVGFDDEGREVAVWVGPYYGPTGYTNYGYWVCMADLETGTIQWLAPAGDSVYHVNGGPHDKRGWAVISNYNPTITNWANQNVFMVELTRRIPKPDWNNHARVWRLTHTHSERGGYIDDAFAKANKKGSKVWFGSNWGLAYSKGGQYNLYQINLPPTWYQDLMGNLPPTASISATPLSGKPPLTVNFTGSGKDVDGTVASYTWNFGDGSTSNQQNPSHTYETPGSYTVSLKVTDDKGAIGSANVTINVLKSDTTPPAVPTGVKIIK